jgi:predicted permease
MPDWRAYVRERLPRLPAAPEREAEIVEELAQQLQDIFESSMRAGASDAEAMARVTAEIRDWPALARDLIRAEQPVLARPRTIVTAQVEPAVSACRAGPWLLERWRDARHAVRALAAQPLFAITTLLTFALGIGATTVMFSLVHSVLLSPLPYRDPGRLVVIQQVVPEIADRYPILGVNARSFTAWKAACQKSCRELAVVARTAATLTGAGEPEGLVGVKASADLFDVLGVRPLAGRLFVASEDVPGRDRVAILTHGLWQRRFGGDPSIVGRTIALDGIAVEVVGILPASFRMPQLARLSDVASAVEFFRPMAWADEMRRSWGEYDNLAVLRLPEGVSIEVARDELTAITTTEFAEAPIHPYPVLHPLIDAVTAESRRPLWLMLGAVAAALLIACVNVASLLGGRWIGRQRELAIRTAMGAGRGRLAALVAVESLVLATAGGLLGVALASISLRTIVALAPASIPRLDEVRLDLVPLAFAAVVTMVCALLCSILPAWRAASVDPGDSLKAGSHTTTAAGRWTAVRSWLVGGEVALTTVLLLVGGLLIASFVNVLRIDRGFSTASVVAGDIDLPAARYATSVERARFFDSLLDGLDGAAGVDGSGISRALPLEGDATVDAMIPSGDARPLAEQLVGNHLQVSDGYFRVMGLPLLRGRLLTRDDAARRVAVINERAARTLWPDRDAIGRSFSRGSRVNHWEVVGIVADSRIRGLEKDPGLVAYVPYGTGTSARMSLVVRARGDRATAVASVRRIVAGLDPQLPLQRVRTMDAVVDDALAMRRFQIGLMTVFGASGLFLACLGVYGVLSAIVEGRRGELAIRLALGAPPGRVRALIVRQGLTPVVLGLAAGLAAGAGAARLAASLFFAVGVSQPAVVGSVAGVVLVVAAAACAEPVLRAARTPLVDVLRRS